MVSPNTTTRIGVRRMPEETTGTTGTYTADNVVSILTHNAAAYEVLHDAAQKGVKPTTREDYKTKFAQGLQVHFGNPTNVGAVRDFCDARGVFNPLESALHRMETDPTMDVAERTSLAGNVYMQMRNDTAEAHARLMDVPQALVDTLGEAEAREAYAQKVLRDSIKKMNEASGIAAEPAENGAE